ncbi:nitroreductase family protein [Kitasatospora sp. NPDC004289]
MNDRDSLVCDRAAGHPLGALADPAGGLGTERAEQTAQRLWRRMALVAAPDGTPRPRPMAVPAELHAALALFEASAQGSATGGHSAPSAGALQPYELRVVTSGPDGPRVFSVDVARRTCYLTHAGEEVDKALCDGGLALPGPDASLVLLVVRPWLSIRKYDERGYLYAQLDTAHLGTHLLCLAAAGHRRAQWLTGAATGPLNTLLGLGDDYLLPHSVLLLDGPAGHRSPEPGAWSCTDHRDTRRSPRRPEHFEYRCWQQLAEFRHEGPTASSGTPPLSLLDGTEAAAPPQPAQLARLARLAAVRRSAKDFGPGPVPADALRRALAAMSTPLPTDLPPADGFGATLVARRVDGLAPGAYRVLRAGTEDAAPRGRATSSDDDLVRICMGQEHLRHTAAAVVFHGRREQVFRHGMAGIDHALLRAGALAHLLYLGATDADVAITTIGGFDAAAWHRLAGLTDQDEVLYVAMLGPRGAATRKTDRLQGAYAHGGR